MNYRREIKKIVLSLTFILIGVICYGQNEDIDIKYISSVEGKVWKRMHRADGREIVESLKDDLFIFYSNGSFKYDHSGTETAELSNGKTKTWSYNKDTNILTWEFHFPSGASKKYSAELTYLDDKRAVMNFSEGSEEVHIVVFITD